MNTRRNATYGFVRLAMTMLAMLPLAVMAQVPVDDNGKVIGAYEPALAPTNQNRDAGNSDVPLMSALDLEDLVGPIALYPDDLLAIVLPAAAYPQQLIDAARFLEDLESDSSLKPDPDWDDSVVALLNYPEVLELLSDDIDWAWRLGEAVIAQQQDVVTAIESFRDRAYNAGNLKSDKYQKVSRDEGYIEITPVEDDVIYVPYYEPERVVVYQPRPVYYYYPRSYPVYYYPYSSAYHFDRGYFWGVTTAFSIGWFTDSLHVYHHSYHGHPYYGHHYRDRWWYRRPTMHNYHSNYIGNSRVTVNNYYSGDRWRPRHDRRDYVRQDVRLANNRYTERRTTERRANEQRRSAEQRSRTQTVRRQEPIAFRERGTTDRSQAQTQRSERRSGTREQRSDGVVRQNREYVANQREQRREPVAQQRERRSTPQPQQREQRATPQQRERRATPQPQQRQQRATPQPQQRQQRATPQPQQRERRATPQPQQQRAAPQRQAQSESRSSQSSSKSSSNSRRSERRDRR